MPITPESRWFLSWICAILIVLATTSAAPSAGPPRRRAVTFSKDVAPILFKHCAGCHRPGEIGPFPLLSFRDAAKRAHFLKEITADRRMPPWKPIHGYGDFQDERRLSEREIRTLARWADSGAKEGDPNDLPAAPKFTDGWQLGKPDLILEMPEPFTVPAGGHDVYRCFVIPTGLKEDRTVAAIEFRPGNRRVVHHTIIVFDTTGVARLKEKEGSGRGFVGLGGGFGFRISGQLGGWAPGATPRRLPEGIGRRLPKNADVVIQIHYVPSGKEEKDQSTVGVFFTHKPARQILTGLMLTDLRIRIAPGEKRHRMTTSYKLPVNVHAIGVLPHMHLLGREMKLTAKLPDGKTLPMLWIKDWDFNWQGQYQYVSPVPLPKGTVLHLEGYFDNTSDNPKNPNNPPQKVTLGMRTKDEMFECRVQLVVDSRTDGPLLGRNLQRLRRERLQQLRRWRMADEE